MLRSPDFDADGYYDNGIQCDWTVIVEPGYVIVLLVDMFNVETEPHCKYDSVKVSIGFAHQDNRSIKCLPPPL